LNEKEQEQFFLEFVNAYNGSLGGYLFDPIISNQQLKILNMNPSFKDRDSVEDMVYSPNTNEQALRRLSEHLYNTQMPYKKIVHYYADSLTFDFDIIPINATEADMKNTTFKKDYSRVWEFFDKFNVKKEFPKILMGMMLEDVKYTYMRKSNTGITLQEMPSDYSIIDAWSELGYLYSFNLMYFTQMGVDINGFSPEFKKFYNNMMDMKSNNTYYPNIKPELRNGQYAYWQQINPNDGWVFKFHNNMATLIPPFLGLFIDAVDIDRYRDLQSTRTAIDLYKIIFGIIPRHKDGTNKSGNSKDDFAVSPEIMAKFAKEAQKNFPENIRLKALPFDDIKVVDFGQNPSEDLVGGNLKTFYRKAGADQALFNADKPNASTMKASTRIDSAFVERCYEQFDTFCTFHINKLTNKYKFKVKFSGTIWDQETRKQEALTLAQSGIVTTMLASAYGLTIRDLQNNMNLMKSLGFVDNLKPLPTSYTTSGKDGDQVSGKDSGRPESDELTPSGELTKDAGSNENKK
jgi:hypothetical protein